MKVSFIILFVLISFISHAEKTNGIINVYFKPGEAASFKLDGNVNIDCGTPDGKWEMIVIYLPAKKEYFDGKIKIKKGDPIMDSNGRRIGIILSDQIDAMPMHNTVDNSYIMRLAGYITTDNVQPASVMENELAQIINSNKKNLSFEIFKKFISDFKLTRWKDDLDKYYPANINYVVWYDSYIGSGAVFRIHLIFSHQKLIAILHPAEIKNTGFAEIKTNMNNLMWLKNDNITEMKKMANTYHKIYEVPDGD